MMASVKLLSRCGASSKTSACTRLDAKSHRQQLAGGVAGTVSCEGV
jgi:hypothetical protein